MNDRRGNVTGRGVVFGRATGFGVGVGFGGFTGFGAATCGGFGGFGSFANCTCRFASTAPARSVQLEEKKSTCNTDRKGNDEGDRDSPAQPSGVIENHLQLLLRVARFTDPKR